VHRISTNGGYRRRMRMRPTTTPAASRRRLVLLACLLLGSAAIVGGIGLRAVVLGQLELRNLVWNLFLAWIPFVVALVLYDTARRGARASSLAALGAVWLVFLPNAPYLVTDVLILDRLVGAVTATTVVLAVGAAAIGLALGFVSVYLVQAVVAARVGQAAGWALAVAALGLSGLGVYLGRYERWNSWEVATEPTKIVGGLVTGLLDPLAHPRPLALSLFFAVASCVGYVVFYTVFRPQLRRLEEH
jgi:uncharacterized membrane protein